MIPHHKLIHYSQNKIPSLLFTWWWFSWEKFLYYANEILSFHFLGIFSFFFFFVIRFFATPTRKERKEKKRRKSFLSKAIKMCFFNSLNLKIFVLISFSWPNLFEKVFYFLSFFHVDIIHFFRMNFHFTMNGEREEWELIAI